MKHMTSSWVRFFASRRRAVAQAHNSLSLLIDTPFDVHIVPVSVSRRCTPLLWASVFRLYSALASYFILIDQQTQLPQKKELHRRNWRLLIAELHIAFRLMWNSCPTCALPAPVYSLTHFQFLSKNFEVLFCCLQLFICLLRRSRTTDMTGEGEKC